MISQNATLCAGPRRLVIRAGCLSAWLPLHRERQLIRLRANSADPIRGEEMPLTYNWPDHSEKSTQGALDQSETRDASVPVSPPPRVYRPHHNPASATRLPLHVDIEPVGINADEFDDALGSPDDVHSRIPQREDEEEFECWPQPGLWWKLSLIVLIALVACVHIQQAHPGGIDGVIFHDALDAIVGSRRSTLVQSHGSDSHLSLNGSRHEADTFAQSQDGSETSHAPASTTNAATDVPPSRTITAGALPDFDSCSAPHVSSLTSSLYHSCPVDHIDWDQLESIGDLMKRTNGIFKTSSMYNSGYPRQVFENICIEGEKEERFTSWVSTGPKEGEPRFEQESSEEQASPTPLPDDAAFPEPAGSRFRWKGYMYKWKFHRHPPVSWKYLPGTTTHLTWVSQQNFGHSLIDHLLPLRMALTQTGEECANTHQHPIERILVDVGCRDDSAGDEEERARSNPPITYGELATAPPLLFAPNQVCPLHSVGAISTRWLMRLSVADPNLYPPTPAFDAQSRTQSLHLPHDGIAGVKFVTMRNAGADGGGHCRRLPGLCFERLVVLGRQEDRDMTSCGGNGNVHMRDTLHAFRNTTFRTFQLPDPFLVLPALGAVAPTSAGPTQPKVPRVLLYGRQDGWRRFWLDVPRTHRLLTKIADAGQISLTFSPGLSSLTICEQVRLFSQSDILLMPQGAGVLASVWSPEGALVLEIFPSADGGSWTGPMRMGLHHRVRHLAGVPAPHRPGGSYRDTGQDDDFTLDPQTWLREFEAAGIDISAAVAQIQLDAAEHEASKQR